MLNVPKKSGDVHVAMKSTDEPVTKKAKQDLVTCEDYNKTSHTTAQGIDHFKGRQHNVTITSQQHGRQGQGGSAFGRDGFVNNGTNHNHEDNTYDIYGRSLPNTSYNFADVFLNHASSYIANLF